jgi:hypothetical protein
MEEQLHKCVDITGMGRNEKARFNDFVESFEFGIWIGTIEAGDRTDGGRGFARVITGFAQSLHVSSIVTKL